ncbi:transcriptional regulator TbsP domain-containing protein [Halobaculum sp. EA56]|uniref:transcriptional regulator TbsP domain-containing protein n=1 Tax=Halobaculum sp. EA56 TaxID=3421648 RepID=UPI003EC10E01
MSTGSPSALARRAVADTSDPLVVAPPLPLARAVVDRLRDAGDDEGAHVGCVRLLCTESVAEATFDDFLAVADAADAVDRGRLAVRTADDLDASLTLADGRVHAHLSLFPQGDDASGAADGGFRDVAAADDSVYEAVAAAYETEWEDADGYDFETPGRSTLVESFGDRWPEAVGTLAGLFEAAESLPADDPLGPVTACTLVAARHRVLTMRLGEWAEEVGFSSRTEIARAKARLVDAGLVDTEREPVGVGRPRHRLVVADDRLADAGPVTLLERGREALGS